MPNDTLHYVFIHEVEVDLPEGSIANLRGQSAQVRCPICPTARQNHIPSGLNSLDTSGPSPIAGLAQNIHLIQAPLGAGVEFLNHGHPSARVRKQAEA